MDPEAERLSARAGGRVRCGWMYSLPSMSHEDLSVAAAVLGDRLLCDFEEEGVPEGWEAVLEVPASVDPAWEEVLGEVLGREVPLESWRVYHLAEGADPLALGLSGRLLRADGRAEEVAAPAPPLAWEPLPEVSLPWSPTSWCQCRNVCSTPAPGQVGGVAVLVGDLDGEAPGFPVVAAAVRSGGTPRRGQVVLRDHSSPTDPPDESPAPAPPPAPPDPEAHLLALLASPDLRSREGWWRSLDYEGLGNLVARPLSPRGVPADGAVAWPSFESHEGLAVAVAVGPAEEARSRALACGGDPARLAVGSRAGVSLALAVVPDVRQVWGFEPLRPGDRVFLASSRFTEARDLVASCKHVGRGGTAVALAMMVLSSGLGVRVAASDPFGEAPGRFVVTVRPEDAEAFAARTGAVNVGDVTVSGRVDFGPLDLPVARLREAWTS